MNFKYIKLIGGGDMDTLTVARAFLMRDFVKDGTAANNSVIQMRLLKLKQKL